MSDEDVLDEVPPSNKGFKIFIIAAVVLVLGGGGAGAYFALAGKGKTRRMKATEMGPTVALDSIIVNLDEPGGTRYLKLSLDIELEEQLDETQNKLSPRLRDKVLVYLGSLTVGQVQKKAGKLEIKNKIKSEAEGVYGKGMVRAVYFKEIVVQ